MATLGNQGFVDDGTGDLQVGGKSTFGGPAVFQGPATFSGATSLGPTLLTTTVLLGSASSGSNFPGGPAPSGFILIPSTGFFSVPVSGSSDKSQAGAGGFTGSLPAPGLWPGGTVMLTDTVGKWSYLLTGSISMNSTNNPYVSASGSHLTVTAGGSVKLVSDGYDWLVEAVKGTATLAA
jgi:hypothetical protein